MPNKFLTRMTCNEIFNKVHLPRPNGQVAAEGGPTEEGNEGMRVRARAATGRQGMRSSFNGVMCDVFLPFTPPLYPTFMLDRIEGLAPGVVCPYS